MPIASNWKRYRIYMSFKAWSKKEPMSIVYLALYIAFEMLPKTKRRIHSINKNRAKKKRIIWGWKKDTNILRRLLCAVLNASFCLFRILRRYSVSVSYFSSILINRQWYCEIERKKKIRNKSATIAIIYNKFQDFSFPFHNIYSFDFYPVR